MQILLPMLLFCLLLGPVRAMGETGSGPKAVGQKTVLYMYRDDKGTSHFVTDINDVPGEYREQLRQMPQNKRDKKVAKQQAASHDSPGARFHAAAKQTVRDFWEYISSLFPSRTKDSDKTKAKAPAENMQADLMQAKKNMQQRKEALRKLENE